MLGVYSDSVPPGTPRDHRGLPSWLYTRKYVIVNTWTRRSDPRHEPRSLCRYLFRVQRLPGPPGLSLCLCIFYHVTHVTGLTRVTQSATSPLCRLTRRGSSIEGTLRIFYFTPPRRSSSVPLLRSSSRPTSPDRLLLPSPHFPPIPGQYPGVHGRRPLSRLRCPQDPSPGPSSVVPDLRVEGVQLP